MRSAVAFCCAAVLVGCGHRAPGRLSFSYRVMPHAYVDHGVVSRRGEVRVHDVSIGRVAGYLVEAPGAPGRPGVVLVHGSAGDRGELLDRALELARAGAVAITITEPSSLAAPPPPTTVAQLLAESRAEQVEDVVAVRRAADVLVRVVHARPLGYLGWSAGAKTGTFVAASDPRFRALALLSAGAQPVESFVAEAPSADSGLVRTQLGLIDPLRYVALARPHSLLLEDGTRDEIVPRAALLNVVHAAPRGTEVRWVRDGHALDDAAWRYAERWLLRRLRAGA